MRKYIYTTVKFFLLLTVLSFSTKVKAQTAAENYTHVIDYTTSANTNSSFLALHSVTLAPGFSFTPTTLIPAFHIYIDGKDPITVDPTIVQNNTIRTDIIKKPGVTTDAAINALSTALNEVQTSYTYMDGMGRPIQAIQSQASPLGNDMVQLAAYDNLGRTPIQYLPYTASTTTGAFQANAFAAQSTFYNTANQKIATDNSPFAVTTYDASPLERVMSQGGVGQDWQPGSGHTVQNNYRLNAANEVLIWTAAGASGFYAANLLSVKETTDENGNIVHNYFNPLGQTILKRVDFNENITENGVTTPTTYLDTYYIYDDFSRLIYQVPPKAAAKIAAGAAWNAAFISQWVFNYIYDSYGRLVQKNVPGSAPVYLVYNQMDQLVMRQDGNLGATNRWYFVKYDQKHRPVMSGIWAYTDPGTSGATPQAKLQAKYNLLNYDGTDKYYEERSSGGTHAYTNQSYPTSGLTIETVNYYDTYDIYGSGTGSPNFSYSNKGITTTTATEDAAAFGRCNSMPTASKKLMVGSTKWIVHVGFYDKYGHMIQQISNNHLVAVAGTTNPSTLSDAVTNVYNFDGSIAAAQSYKNITSSNITVLNKFTYDNWGRLFTVTQSNNGVADQVVGSYAYNEMGQLVDRKLHKKSDGTYLQSVDYRYNIRGWLTNINSADLTHNTNTGDAADLFGMDISYDNTETGFIDGTTYKPYYNGEIAAVKWGVASDGTTTRPERSYRFTYDKANRLRKSYSAALSGTTWSTELGGYNENADYDQNGNILHLDRNTMYNGTLFTMDNLTYSYVANGNTYGNQLQKVDDAVANTTGMTEFKDNANIAQEYAYDSDGNLLSDANKGSAAAPVAYTYNDINKVSKADFGSGNYDLYTYDAAGIRLQRLVYAAGTLTSTFDYLDGYIYKNTTLISLPMPEGRVTVAAGVYQYEYIIKDNQGNSRVSFILGSNGTALLIQENHYYPFGMTLKGPTISTLPVSPNQFLYNGGSELQEDNSSNIYSTFYREYDPALGRFQAVDVDADNYGDVAPYAFAADNPVIFNDPLGSDYSDAQAMSDFGKNYYNTFYLSPAQQWYNAISQSSQWQDFNSAQFAAPFSPVAQVYDFNGNVRNIYQSDIAAHGDAQNLILVTYQWNWASTDENGNSIIKTKDLYSYIEIGKANQGGWDRNYRQFLVTAIMESKNAEDAAGIAAVMLNRMEVTNTTFDNDDWLYRISQHHPGRTVDQDIHTAFNAYSTDPASDYQILLNKSNDKFFAPGSKWSDRLNAARTSYDGYQEGFDASEGAYLWNGQAQIDAHKGPYNKIQSGILTVIYSTGPDGTAFIRYTDPNRTWP